MSANTASTLSALLREVYADGLDTLIPEGVRIIRDVKFSKGDKEIGDKYVQPVALTHEAGFSVGSGAFTLNSAIAAIYEEAQVEGKNLLLRTRVSYDAAAKASSSKKAFVKWSEQVVANMTSSFTKRLEVLHFYGGVGLATVSALNDDAGGTNVLSISAASWASGIWAGSEGMELDAYTSTTKQNSTGALVVDEVDLINKTITVTGAAADTAAIDVGSVLYFRGFYGNEMNGIDKLVTNSGSLYNISASTYALWKGNSYSAGSAELTFAKIQRAIALAVGKGLDEKVVLYCSPATYADLNTDLSAFRSADQSYNAKKGKNGYESICFHSLCGEIEIMPSIYCKEGEAFILPLKRMKRIGSTDVTMKMPGQDSEQLVTQVHDAAAYEMRLFYDGNLFAERPGFLVKITAIVNRS